MSLALVYPGLYLQHSLAPACAATSWASLVPLSCGLGPAMLLCCLLSCARTIVQVGEIKHGELG